MDNGVFVECGQFHIVSLSVHRGPKAQARLFSRWGLWRPVQAISSSPASLSPCLAAECQEENANLHIACLFRNKMRQKEDALKSALTPLLHPCENHKKEITDEIRKSSKPKGAPDL